MDYSKILYIKGEDCFLHDGKELSESSFSKAKNYPVALLVPPSALFMHTQKMPANIDEEQKEGDMEISMYKDGGANENEDYTTALITHKLPEGGDELVELFGLPYTLSDKLYSNITSKTKAIDLMAPSFLIYEALYDQKIKSTDLYIYLADEEAYGALYVDGEFKAYRSIDSLSALSLKCGWELDILKAALKTRGINESSYNKQDITALNAIQETLSKNIEKIIHTINHKRGLFGINEIDRIYIDFEGSNIDGLEKIFQAYEIEINTISPVKLNDSNNPLLWHDNIGAMYLQGVMNGKHRKINLSKFNRQLPLYKTHVGHLLISLGLALIVAIFYGLFLRYELTNEEEKLNSIKKETKKLSSNIKNAKAIFKKLKKEENATRVELEILYKKRVSLYEIDKVSPFIKKDSIKRQQMIDTCLQGLKQNALHITSLEQNGSKHLFINVATNRNKQQNIAEFMRFMAQKGYSQSHTKQITENNGTYESLVEVAR